jgi:hypothetical protein
VETFDIVGVAVTIDTFGDVRGSATVEPPDIVGVSITIVTFGDVRDGTAVEALDIVGVSIAIDTFGDVRGSAAVELLDIVGVSIAIDTFGDVRGGVTVESPDIVGDRVGVNVSGSDGVALSSLPEVESPATEFPSEDEFVAVICDDVDVGATGAVEEFTTLVTTFFLTITIQTYFILPTFACTFARPTLLPLIVTLVFFLFKSVIFCSPDVTFQVTFFLLFFNFSIFVCPMVTLIFLSLNFTFACVISVGKSAVNIAKINNNTRHFFIFFILTSPK